jgi:integrase
MTTPDVPLTTNFNASNVGFRNNRKLTWARGIVRDWDVVNQLVPWKLTLVIAVGLALMGYPRLGVGLICQRASGLRPSEMLKVKQGDVTLSDQITAWAAAGAVVNLGAKTGAKSGRAQCVVVDRSNCPLAHRLWDIVASSTPASQFVFGGHTLAQFQTAVKLVCRKLGKPEFTAPSPRAGFATEEILKG